MGDHEPPAQSSETEVTSLPASVKLQWLREGVTATIAITILAITSVMLMETFNSAKYMPISSGTDQAARQEEINERDKAFGYQKDILLYGLALLGTVTGYFFGRVPAELHAVQAQKAANVAQDRADVAKGEENKAKMDRARVVDKTLMMVNQALSLATSSPGVSKDIPADAQPATDLAKTRHDLEELRDWLRRVQT